MSATDELRKLLDERGVEYETADGWWTSWDTAGALDVDAVVYCEDLGSGLEIRWYTITPEQAITATLGRGTCRSTTHDDAWCFACSECGKSFPRNELHLAHNHGEINYCPNCGARVERREQ